jgi:hypothetical protein
MKWLIAVVLFFFVMLAYGKEIFIILVMLFRKSWHYQEGTHTSDKHEDTAERVNLYF